MYTEETTPMMTTIGMAVEGMTRLNRLPTVVYSTVRAVPIVTSIMPVMYSCTILPNRCSKDSLSD